jgi:hypothetical protein
MRRICSLSKLTYLYITHRAILQHSASQGSYLRLGELCRKAVSRMYPATRVYYTSPDLGSVLQSPWVDRNHDARSNNIIHPPSCNRVKSVRKSVLLLPLHTLCEGSFKRLLEHGRWNTDSKGQGIGEFSSHETLHYQSSDAFNILC